MATILIVDDIPANREFLTNLLGHRRHRILEASDGAEALERVRDDRPDLVISDVLMPRIDGYEFVRQLRSDAALAHTPVIFFTAAYHDRRSKALARQCGVASVIAKPADPEQIFQAVEAILGGGVPSPLPAPSQEFGREHLGLLMDKLAHEVDRLKRETDKRTHAEAAVAERMRLLSLGADVGKSLTEGESLPDKLRSCADAFVRHLDAAFARIWTLNQAENVLELQASSGLYTHINGPHRRVPVGQFKIGLIAQERRPVLTNEVAGSPRIHNQEWATREGLVAFAGYPLIVADRVVGVIALFARRPLSDSAFQAIATVTNGIALAIERESIEKALRRSEERFRQMAENIGEVVWMNDLETKQIRYVNPAYEEIWGRSCQSLYDQPSSWTDAIHPDDLGHVLEANDHQKDQGEYNVEYRITRPDESVRWIWDRGFPIRDDLGRLAGIVGVARDITARKQAEERLAHQATHDPLTALPNRVLLRERLTRTIAAKGAPDAPFALMVLDLDRFKEINDTFGHHIGDVVLRELCPRLMDAVRPSDTIARLGGDEFGILLPQSDLAESVQTAERLLAALKKPIVVEGQALDVGASIGIALYPDHGRDADTLLQRADIAMYSAKRARIGHASYSPSQANYTPRRLALIGELRQAIDRDELVFSYQPKVDLRTSRLSGVEALVRWPHPREGMLTPAKFIPLAEHTGLIKPLGHWALRTAMRQFRAWHRSGLALNIAVNLATENLQDRNLIQAILNMLDDSDVSHRWLTVEVTESAMMSDPTGTTRVLAELRERGVRIALDDFGTGYSSLSYLKTLPVDELKIDMSFIKDIAKGERDACIVRSIIDLGHDLGLRVVAEGVEDQVSLARLTSWGCDLAQGYYFGRPLPSVELMEWAAKINGGVRLPQADGRSAIKARTGRAIRAMV